MGDIVFEGLGQFMLPMWAASLRGRVQRIAATLTQQEPNLTAVNVNQLIEFTCLPGDAASNALQPNLPSASAL
jgi:hypothetical protein